MRCLEERGWGGGRESVGWRIGRRLTCLLTTEQRGKVQDHLRSHEFLCSVVFVLVFAVIILIHLVVVIFSSHTYAQHVILVLLTGGLNTIACICRRGEEAGFSELVYGWHSIAAWGICLGEGGASPFFTGCGCVCVVSVCVRAHTHSACEVLGCHPRCRARHLESLEESQMYCSDRIHIPYSVPRRHICIYAGLQVETAFLFSFNMFFLSQKNKTRRCEQHQDLESRWIWANISSNKGTRLRF